MATKVIGGVATVAAPGTAVRLSEVSKVVRLVVITVSATAYLGGSDVLASSPNGAKLITTAPFTLEAPREGFGGGIDLYDVWADSSTAGCVVSYVALED